MKTLIKEVKSQHHPCTRHCHPQPACLRAFARHPATICRAPRSKFWQNAVSVFTHPPARRNFGATVNVQPAYKEHIRWRTLRDVGQGHIAFCPNLHFINAGSIRMQTRMHGRRFQQRVRLSIIPDTVSGGGW
jgi:hypothetical protein